MKPFLTLLPLALLLTVPHAQQSKSRIGFVDVQKLVAAVPGNTAYLNLSKSADADLNKRDQAIRALVTKANTSKSVADRTALQKAQQASLTAQKDYQTRLAAAFKPLAGKIDGAIASVAKSNGYTVVMDRGVAARTKLIVYGATSTDLTEAALKVLKKIK